MLRAARRVTVARKRLGRPARPQRLLNLALRSLRANSRLGEGQARLLGMPLGPREADAAPSLGWPGVFRGERLVLG